MESLFKIYPENSNKHIEKETSLLRDNIMNLEPYEDFDELTFEIENAGVRINRINTIIDFIYKKPFVRNFSKGELEEVNVKNLKLVTMLDLGNNSKDIKNKKELDNYIKSYEYINVLFNDPSFSFQSNNINRKFLRKTTKPLIVLFKPDKNFKLYRENFSDTDKEIIDGDKGVIIKVKGVETVITETKNLIIDSIYTLDENMELKELKDSFSITPFKEVMFTDINMIMKRMMEKASKLNEY